MPEATALVTYTPSHHLQNLLNHLSYSSHIQSSISQPTHSPPPYSQPPSFILRNSSSPTSPQIIHRQSKLHLCLACRLERPSPHHQVSTVARTLQAPVKDSPLQNSVGRRTEAPLMLCIWRHKNELLLLLFTLFPKFLDLKQNVQTLVLHKICKDTIVKCLVLIKL